MKVLSPQPSPILQSRLPFLPWMDPRTRRLPGVLPVEGEEWLAVDDAYAAQMAERARILREVPEVVHAILPEGVAAVAELYDVVLDRLTRQPGFRIGQTTALRPDGVEVALDPANPMMTLGHLVQEDLCLMEAAGQESRLTAGLLCFPASWSLRQKLGRALVAIHAPVTPYDNDVARRVQRLFDAIRPGQPLWRMNFLTYDDHTLHQPRTEGQRRPRPTGHFFVRCERQCMLRLPKTRAVVFAIHTYVVLADTLTPAELACLRDAVH
jgi:dimethylamine monooxygenase subunit A